MSETGTITEHAQATQYAASWVSLHPQADLPSNELSIGCGVSTSTLPAAPKTSTSLCHANSVAVETTVDLMNFNDSNAGNCCWSPADSFAHMQTQTTGDAELDQWLNSVHTQTVFQQTPPDANASSSTNWLSPGNGVCVGVNTDLRTPDGCNQFVFSHEALVSVQHSPAFPPHSCSAFLFPRL
ncbi:unnamed protein product [Dibothriocephalus latus]|uniref:Uncharacterized protein n=1 Tax=Dibothriocephalus latus TaxID=60516 RepID=A0A3P6PVV6_DIBLA|nr:unnamed protein product [Dibothriocephalus latus]